MKTKIFFINIFFQNCDPVIEKVVYKEKDNEMNDKIEELKKRVDRLESKLGKVTV